MITVYTCTCIYSIIITYVSVVVELSVIIVIHVNDVKVLTWTSVKQCIDLMKVMGLWKFVWTSPIFPMEDWSVIFLFHLLWWMEMLVRDTDVLTNKHTWVRELGFLDSIQNYYLITCGSMIII